MKKLDRQQPSSLRKSKKILLHTYHLYKRQKKRLSPATHLLLESSLKELQEALLASECEKAAPLAEQLERLAHLHLKRSPWQRGRDFFFSLLGALLIAILVRQVWFEFYEIPTGSMRPTLKEQDRLVVSKTDFGINVPLTPKQFYFSPDLVQRGGIVVFTGENMDISNVDTLYFYLFPGKKQYVKRLMGKPGDTLYFYGGLIYGFDKEGRDISAELQPPRLDQIDHIPFIHFEGKSVTPQRALNNILSPVVIYQMNQPIARLSLSSYHHPRAEMLISKDLTPQEYGDLWGINNYAMARLLTPNQLKTVQNPYALSEKGLLYLELKHHPSLAPLDILQDELGRLRPALSFETSFLALDESHLRTLFSHLYTARFVVKNGVAQRYGTSELPLDKNPFLPRLPDVPDGCYEFYHGKAFQVKWQGITVALPEEHPLYQFSPERVQLFFNMGIEFDTRYMPQARNQRLFPARYAYFRQGDLYLLGAPIVKQGDPYLAAFLTQESQKRAPFRDEGPPLTPEGSLDIALIKHYGLKIPERSYLALGDNHAMSADSRDFGFVPAENLRGGPDFIFWPPGNRWGAPNQVPYPWVTPPRIVIWLVAALSIAIWRIVYNRRNRLPLNL
jgi:signal peptidase I